MQHNVCHVCRLGRVEYSRAWALQRRLAEARAEGAIPDTLLLLEHPPTYTIGKRGNEANILVSRDVLLEEGIELFHVDRGGDITFHGPGQLVGYPILSLADRPGGPSRYLRDLEQVIITGLEDFGVSAGRIPSLTGVWVKDEKIAAIGVKITARRVTIHGFALNVSTDLSHFARIIPCGIREKSVTSLGRFLNRSVTVQEAGKSICSAMGEVFGLDMTDISPNLISGYLNGY